MKKNINKDAALVRLQQIVDLAATKITDSAECYSIISNKNKTVNIGQYSIKKTAGCYTVWLRNKVLYKDIFLAETAFALVLRELKARRNTIRGILELDDVCAKHRTDMMYYMRSYKDAVAKASDDRYMYIDRYLVSRDKAETAYAALTNSMWAV